MDDGNYLTGAHLAKATLAQHAVHAERLVRDGLRLQPLPLQVSMEVHTPRELPKGLVRQARLHRLHARREEVLVAVGQLVAGGQLQPELRKRKALLAVRPAHELLLNRVRQLHARLARLDLIAFGRFEEL